MLGGLVKDFRRSMSSFAQRVDQENMDMSKLGKHKKIDLSNVITNTKSLQVTPMYVQGWTRKKNNSQNNIMETYPSRYLQLRRDTG